MGNTFVVLGADRDYVVEALNAVGGGETLKKGEGVLANLAQGDGVIFASSADFANMKTFKPRNPMMKQASSIQMSVKETKSNTVVAVDVDMNSNEAAQQLLALSQGGLAMMRLKTAEKPAVRSMVDRVGMTAAAERVSFDFEAPSVELIDTMKQAKAECHK